MLMPSKLAAAGPLQTRVLRMLCEDAAAYRCL